MQGRIWPRLEAVSGVLYVALLMGSTSTGLLAAITAPTCLVNGMFLDAEFGPAFLLVLLWVTLASIVLTLRTRRAPVEAAASSRAARPVPLR